MNDDTIEKLLSKAPPVAAPAGLRNRLQTQIRLPQPDLRRTDASDNHSWLRRLIPALSFAAFFLTCIVAIGVQTNLLSQLKAENASLRAAAHTLDQLRADNQEFQKLSALNQELERLRKDNQEVQSLRAEVAQLQAQLADAPQLKAENQRLHAAQSAGANPGANASGDFFAQARDKAERIQCVNNLKQIGLAARIWANDHGDVQPMDFLSISNELNTAGVLKCPGDKSRTVTNWSDVAAGNFSYQLDAPGIPDTEPTVVFAECPIHHNLLLVDGSVQQTLDGTVQQFGDGTTKTVVKVVNGRKVFVP